MVRLGQKTKINGKVGAFICRRATQRSGTNYRMLIEPGLVIKDKLVILNSQKGI